MTLGRQEPALVAIAREAVAAMDGEALCEAAVAARSWPSTLRVLAVGKAAGAMARGACRALAEQNVTTSGLIITKDGHLGGFVPAGLRAIFAGHPEPDARSEAAAAALLSAVAEGGHHLGLLWRGALARLPARGVGRTLAERQGAARAVLASGEPIAAMNLVRRHLTRCSGGRPARDLHGEATVLVLSDVLGDAIADIGSGPFAPAEEDNAGALAIAQRVRGMPGAVLTHLRAGRDRDDAGPVGAGASCWARVATAIIASCDTLLDAAEVAAARHLPEVARVRLAPSGGLVPDVAARLLAELDEAAPNTLIVAGGEPTVVLPAEPGLGGRNQAPRDVLSMERIGG